jgi:hypothetical protein
MATEMESLLEMLRSGQKADKPVDWELVRKEWVQAIDDLYAQVKDWLKPAIQDGLVQVQEEGLTITEDDLGEYDTHALRITTPAGRLVNFVPKYRLVYGGLGRVDMESGAAKQVLMRKQPGEWDILLQQVPRREERLTEESFARLLKAVLA